jgi:hypothetical protein
MTKRKKGGVAVDTGRLRNTPPGIAAVRWDLFHRIQPDGQIHGHQPVFEQVIAWFRIMV